LGRLRDAARALKAELGEAQLSALIRYVDLLAQWNRVYNLTAVRDREAMLDKHVIDSLSIIAPLRRHAGQRPIRVLDVGSGGGLPGVVIAVGCPEYDVTCVDAVAKKAEFVRHVAVSLSLPNLHALHERAERLDAPLYDVIVTRAFGTLGSIVEATRRVAAAGAVWLMMKGRDPVDERHALPGDVEAFHVEPLVVPHLGAARCIVWIRRRVVALT
jgi:16S rRNA (guanine527-N7)-methyltransferase